MLLTTDTLQAASFIKEQFGNQDVRGLDHDKKLGLVESITSLDTVLDAITTNQEFDLFAVDRILLVVGWVRSQLNEYKKAGITEEYVEFRKNAKLFSNFVNRLIDFRIKKYNEMTSLDKFLNGYS